MKTNKQKFSILLCCLTIVFFAASSQVLAATYYVDSVSGNDANSGTSTGTPWKNLTEVNSRSFNPGDRILLKSGSVWSEQQLLPKGSGSSGNPIVIDKYGTGALPKIQTKGAFSAAVYLFNQKHWEFKNFEITNFTANTSSLKRGVYIEARDYGTVDHIYLLNLYIHDVNGDVSDKDNGGIFFEINGTAVQTKFNDILIDGCTISNVDRTGISNQSSWSDRTETVNTSWVPSTNVVIRNNNVSSTGGNGLIWRVSQSPLIEYNVFADCADSDSGNAVFVFNNDDAKMQYNEAYGTVFNTGDLDAGGFDADYKSKRTIIQYNYAHDNGLGGIVAVCSGGGSNPSFNSGVQIKYNILQNNLRQAFRFSGCVEGAKIYNNTIFFKSTISDVEIIRFKDWGGYPNGTKFYNNIFFNNGSNSSYVFGASTNNVFDYNLFYPNHPASEPSDAHKLTTNPSLVSVGSGTNGINSVGGYKLKPASPAIDSGTTVSGSGNKDFFGSSVPYNTTTDRGANEYHP